MDARAVPTVTLTLDYMVHEIKHHLGINGSELGEVIEQRVKEELAKNLSGLDGTIEMIVRREIDDKIKRCIEDYFKCGEGSHYIYNKVTNILESVFKDYEKKPLKPIDNEPRPIDCKYMNTDKCRHENEESTSWGIKTIG